MKIFKATIAGLAITSMVALGAWTMSGDSADAAPPYAYRSGISTGYYYTPGIRYGVYGPRRNYNSGFYSGYNVRNYSNNYGYYGPRNHSSYYRSPGYVRPYSGVGVNVGGTRFSFSW
ncbi:hypothetical protein [Calycomorphotria hydatis]|uniref:Uncharacterized protein n=1 Tax=Calycomorphotria hydatis TaxID=2528027 RepID=A0A517T9L3_9PLAN|nr:hypothetical protein [Calycomorphotria hydatis]QDT65065.1 hypothetical protein V22_23110 [Calycomorphotria hydatis]